MVHLDAHAAGARRDELAAALTTNYGIVPDKAVNIPMTGTPEQVAERFAEYASIGATHLVLNAVGDDWLRQVELIAYARTHLDPVP